MYNTVLSAELREAGFMLTELLNEELNMKYEIVLLPVEGQLEAYRLPRE